ncbi:MAG TPA: hypothetical protein VL307_08810 [Chitinophagaceae bacterium]|nr:hypothetical protein [Chitinophagaceae bacterium]
MSSITNRLKNWFSSLVSRPGMPANDTNNKPILPTGTSTAADQSLPLQQTADPSRKTKRMSKAHLSDFTIF